MIVANEMRSALDEFIRAARKNCCLAVERDGDGTSGDTDVALAPAAVPYDYVWDLQVRYKSLLAVICTSNHHSSTHTS